MAVRDKTATVEKLVKQLQDFELPLNIAYKNYVQIVGARNSITPPEVKKNFKAWKYLLHAAKIRLARIEAAKPKPEPKVEPKPEPKPEVVSKPKPKSVPKPPKAKVKPAAKPAVKTGK